MAALIMIALFGCPSDDSRCYCMYLSNCQMAAKNYCRLTTQYFVDLSM